MTDRDMTAESGGTSRRTMLKGAVGAGVGLAAWSAPKIGSVPAYALTSSTGLFNNVCYYFLWNANVGQKRWGRGQTNPNVGMLTGKDTGFADGLTVGTTDRSFTWNDVFGPGQDLVVRANGNPESGTAIITLVTTAPGCVFEEISAATYTTQPANPPGSGGSTATCVSGLTTNSGTVAFNPTAGTVSGISPNNRHYIVFNIDCS